MGLQISRGIYPEETQESDIWSDPKAPWRVAGKTKNFTGENFWARGYFVTTIGLDEEMVRAYVRNQDKEDAHYDQLKLGM